MSCMDELVSSQQVDDCLCPTCNEDLIPPPDISAGTMIVGGIRVDAEPLSDSQPLAYLLLTQIEVECPCRNEEGCEWFGDYADLAEHLQDAGHGTDHIHDICTIKDGESVEHQDDDGESVEYQDNDEKNSKSIAVSGSTDSMDNDTDEPVDDPIRQAESLKDKANSVFSDGDYEEARAIYSKGLAYMGQLENRTREGSKLYATLYCNRAAAFLREQLFSSCIEDCDAALAINPEYPKAFVRKAKALIEMGLFGEACSCLEEGIENNPNSEGLVDEFRKAKKMLDRIVHIEELLKKKDYRSAKDLLSVFPDNSSNNRLLLAAARADTGLGLTETALDKCLKVLGADPDNADALQVEGILTYLIGDFNEAIGILDESLDVDPNNDTTKDLLRGCQKGAKVIQEGRAALSKERYKRAIEQFTIAIDDCMPVPPKAPLYSILHAERAEAFFRSKQYYEALTDCTSAIEAKEDNVAAWVTKAEVYNALGRHQEARDELAVVKRSWGAKHKAIKEAFNKADFEVRIQQVDMELRHMVATADARSRQGTNEENSSSGKRSEGKSSRKGNRLPPTANGEEGQTHKYSNRRKSNESSSSMKKKVRDTNHKSSSISGNRRLTPR